jgi:hypothetical protein
MRFLQWKQTMFKSLVVAVALLPLAVQASNLPEYPFIHTTAKALP